MNDERMTVVPKDEWLELTEKAREYNALEIRNARLQSDVDIQRKVIIFYRILVVSLIAGFSIIRLNS